VLLAAKALLAGTLTYDDDKEGYFARRAAGILDGSLRIPGTNLRVVVTGTPAGNVLALGATLYEQLKRPAESFDERATRGAKAVVGVATEQPLFKAIKETMGDRSLGELGGAYVGSFVPTIISDVGDVMDKNARQAKGFTAQILKRVPPLVPKYNRKALPPSPTPIGGPDERGDPARRMLRAIDPFSTTRQQGSAPTPSPVKSKGTIKVPLPTPRHSSRSTGRGTGRMTR
jgi:hypothetical protein